MKLFKKIFCSALLITALLTSVQTTAHAAVIDRSPGAMRFYSSESGTVVVNSGTHKIFDYYGNPTGLTYGPGESFYYDSVYTFTQDGDVFFFASYVNSSKVRRYINTSSLTRDGLKYVTGLTIY